MPLGRPLAAFQQWILPRLPHRLRALPGPALAIISLLVVVNLVVWAAVGIVLRFFPGLTGTAVLAYTLGLRHALDADHISAIDLMTRRLIASGQRPVAVGTFFSLGHSTIVVITCVVVAATSGALRERFNGFERVGNIIGTSVSAAVLLILCAGNAWVLWRLVRGLRMELRKQHEFEELGAGGEAEGGSRGADNGGGGGGGETNAGTGAPDQDEARSDSHGDMGADAVAAYDEEAYARARSGPNAVAAATAFESPTGRGSRGGSDGGDGSAAAAGPNHAAHLKLEGGGFLVRIFRRLFVLIDRPWKMYPLGVLFGLGFDTSSEVALLGIASIQGAKGTSMWLILIFPALFTAGMCMVDTTDGALMMVLYTSKAFSRDTVAILYYSIVLTAITIVVAAFIGIVQVLTLVSNVASPTGRFWDGVGAIGDNFEIVGGSICGVFLIAGIGSVLLYKPWRRRMDRRQAARAAQRAAVVHAIDEDDVRGAGADDRSEAPAGVDGSKAQRISVRAVDTPSSSRA